MFLASLTRRALACLARLEGVAMSWQIILMEALAFGARPHGGIALGLDRVAMLIGGYESIRDVIAFPKTTSGTDLMQESPTPVTERQLTEVGMRLL
jgi:aspartyl-tRNA synthetase